jgi:Protein of unknown function (DUF3800)
LGRESKAFGALYLAKYTCHTSRGVYDAPRLGVSREIAGPSRGFASNFREARWFAVLSCYLDDSGTDESNPVVTVAGYIARDDNWKLFEGDVEKWFTEFNVGVLHAKELRSTDNDFKDWKVLRKHAFVSRICQEMNKHLLMGLTTSAAKERYKERATGSDKKRVVTAYSSCFNMIIDWILRDIRLGKIVNEEGVALILEAGNKNNSEVQILFNEIREKFNLHEVLRSISFVPKISSRAIQIADLLAFYSRRSAVALFEARRNGKEAYKIDVMDRILVDADGLPYRAFVALDFNHDPVPSDDWDSSPYWRPPS